MRKVVLICLLFYLENIYCGVSMYKRDIAESISFSFIFNNFDLVLSVKFKYYLYSFLLVPILKSFFMLFIFKEKKLRTFISLFSSNLTKIVATYIFFIITENKNSITEMISMFIGICILFYFLVIDKIICLYRVFSKQNKSILRCFVDFLAFVVPIILLLIYLSISIISAETPALAIKIFSVKYVIAVILITINININFAIDKYFVRLFNKNLIETKDQKYKYYYVSLIFTTVSALLMINLHLKTAYIISLKEFILNLIN